MKLLKGFGIAAIIALFFAPHAALCFDDNVTINGITTQGVVLRDAVTGAPYSASGGSGSTGGALETGGNLDFIADSVTGLNNAIGTAAAGLAGNKSLLGGGVYNSSVPTLTNGQQAAFQFDSSANLKVNSTLPTGAATSANQSTEITSLATIATNSGTQSTAANQTTANSSLSTIATQTARFPYLATAGQGTVGIIASAASNCTTGTAGCNMLDASNVPWTETRGYGGPVVITVVSSTTTGAYTVETASDSSGTNTMTQTCYYYGPTLSNAQASFPVALTNNAGTGGYRIFCPINNGYTRVRITTTTGASSAFSLIASNQMSPYVAAQQFSTWTMQPGNTANTTPWLVTPTIASNVDRSSTITTGGTSQQLFAASTSTRGFIIYNNDTTEVLCFNAVGGSAALTTQGSICLSPAGASASGGFADISLTNQAVNVIGATTGHKFTAWEKR